MRNITEMYSKAVWALRKYNVRRVEASFSTDGDCVENVDATIHAVNPDNDCYVDVTILAVNADGLLVDPKDITLDEEELRLSGELFDNMGGKSLYDFVLAFVEDVIDTEGYEVENGFVEIVPSTGQMKLTRSFYRLVEQTVDFSLWPPGANLTPFLADDPQAETEKTA
jgi:hypothetical protein